MTQRPSEWIMQRAREKAQREREGEKDLIKAGVFITHRHATEDEHVRARSGWFLAEAIMEWADHFAADSQETLEKIGADILKMRETMNAGCGAARGW